MNTFKSPNEAFTLTIASSPREELVLERVSSISSGIVKNFDLQPEEEFWFAGAAPGKQVHGFLLKPRDYQKDKKYGLAFLVHGGELAPL